MVVDNCAFAEDVISFIVIRNPIERIFSLYWYEHVDFYYNIKNQPFKTKNFKVWMEAWLDGSTWKREISNKYSYENYVEIENYYIKTLIGWKGDENRTININDYRKACCILERHFDVIFLTEWLEHRNQSLLLDRIHPGASGFFIPKVVGKKKLKKRLSRKLIGGTSDLYKFRKILEEKNVFDIMLWNYVRELVRERITLLSQESFSASSAKRQYCQQRSSMDLKSCRNSRKIFGLFQTPGHKGPF